MSAFERVPRFKGKRVPQKPGPAHCCTCGRPIGWTSSNAGTFADCRACAQDRARAFAGYAAGCRLVLSAIAGADSKDPTSGRRPYAAPPPAPAPPEIPALEPPRARRHLERVA